MPKLIDAANDVPLALSVLAQWKLVTSYELVYLKDPGIHLEITVVLMVTKYHDIISYKAQDYLFDESNREMERIAKRCYTPVLVIVSSGDYTSSCNNYRYKLNGTALEALGPEVLISKYIKVNTST